MNSKEILIQPEAEKDIQKAFYYYEECLKGLGSDFILAVDEILHLIQRNPKIFQLVYKNIRRGLTKRFPFGIFYINTETRIIVIAVLHLKRDSKTYKNRNK